MDQGVDPCLTGPELRHLLRCYEDARVWLMTVGVWREVCWPREAVWALLRSDAATIRKQVRASKAAYVEALKYIVQHDLDHPPEGAADYLPLAATMDPPLSSSSSQQQQRGGERRQGPSSAEGGGASTSLARTGAAMSLEGLGRAAGEATGTGAAVVAEEEEVGVDAELRLEEEEDDEAHPSLLALLHETLRVAAASILLDLSQMPFLNVSVCALAGRGRLPALQTPPGFGGYAQAFRAIVAAEGLRGLFTGAVPVCLMGLVHNWNLLAAADEDDGSHWLTTGALASRFSSGYFARYRSISGSGFLGLGGSGGAGGGSSSPPSFLMGSAPPPPLPQSQPGHEHEPAREPPSSSSSSSSSAQQQQQPVATGNSNSNSNTGLHHSHHTEHLLQLSGAVPTEANEFYHRQREEELQQQLQQQQQQGGGDKGPPSQQQQPQSQSQSQQQHLRQWSLPSSATAREREPSGSATAAAAAAGAGVGDNDGASSVGAFSTGRGALETAKGTTTRALPRLFRAALVHPLQLLALASICDPRPQFRAYGSALAQLRASLGGWSGLWQGLGTTLATTFFAPAEPLLYLALPFLLRSRQMLAVIDGVAGPRGGGGAAGGGGGSTSARQSMLVITRQLVSKDGFQEVVSGWKALAWGVLPSLAAWTAARVVIDLCGLGFGEGPRKRRRWALRRARVRRLLRRQVARIERRQQEQEREQAQEKQRLLQQEQQQEHQGFQRRQRPPEQQQRQQQLQQPEIQYRYFDEESRPLPGSASFERYQQQQHRRYTTTTSSSSASASRPPQQQQQRPRQQGRFFPDSEEEEQQQQQHQQHQQHQLPPLKGGGGGREEGGEDDDSNPQSPARPAAARTSPVKPTSMLGRM